MSMLIKGNFYYTVQSMMSCKNEASGSLQTDTNSTNKTKETKMHEHPDTAQLSKDGPLNK